MPWFQIEAVLAEERFQLQGLGLRPGVIVVDQQLRDLPGQAPRQADKALGVLMQQRPVDPGLDVEALGKAGRDQITEVAVAGLVFAQKDQVTVLLVAPRLAVKARARGDIDLAADDGLDPRRLTGLIEGHRAVHDPVVGERDGALAELPDARGKPVRAAGAVEQAEFTVNMKVNKSHGSSPL